MKKIIIFLCLITQFGITAQNEIKRDYIWLFGYGGEGLSKDTFYSNIIIDFKEKKIEPKKLNILMEYNDDLAIIADTIGQLLFYTNGIYVADSTHQPMKNGNGLNPGDFATQNKDDGYILAQGSLILPKPNSNHLFYLFHISLILDKDTNHKGEKFYYTIIDMSKNNGKGEVIEKNKIIHNGFVDAGKITSCRHANGTDWWIIVADWTNKIFYTYLFDKNGITLIQEQNFVKGNLCGLGQAVFSPDGTKYARFNNYSLNKKNEIFLYDFDRCTGRLSNQKEFLASKNMFGGGIAFSRNSKYLYAAESKYVYQIDVDQTSSTLKGDTVAVADGVKPPESFAPTTFYLAQLAPDNKIYLSMTGSHKYLHIIHEPNKKGKACNVQQRGLVLPTKNYTTMPNFPNFRLGAAAAPCNSVASEDIKKEKNDVKIYPNPSMGNITIDCGSLTNTQLNIYDINGKVVLSQYLINKLTPINVEYLTNGIYYCRLLGVDNTLKFTIIH